MAALSLHYGQKHIKEIECARKIARYYGVMHIEHNIEKVFDFSECSLLKGSKHRVPLETYAEQLKKTNGKPVSTYVPFRNGLFLAIAASIAISLGAKVLYYGAHADDAAGNAYPDCSEEFNKAINEAVYIGSGKELRAEAPFIGKPKAEVVRIGLEFGAPYKMTWSCYNGGEKPCGKCGTCIDRKRAFEINEAKDPLKY